MDLLHITGGQPLSGQIRISGSKNGTLPLLAASLLVEGETVIDNIPDIQDVGTMINMLKALGARCTFLSPGKLRIDASNITSVAPPDHLVRAMRASFYVAGPLLARFGEAQVPLPGGCSIGERKVDQHINGFVSLGAQVHDPRGGVLHMQAGKLQGNKVYLDSRTRSVGATVNIMLAATLAEGTTIIENASCEPEVVSCAEFLQACGADIQGVGTSRLFIRGVKKLHPAEGVAIPDRMETGTFLIAGLVTRGDVTVTNVNVEHMDVVIRELTRVGAQVERGPDFIRLRCRVRPTCIEISTQPYPGFPTDLQPNMAVVGAIGVGTSVIEETIFDGRFNYTDELVRMGAEISVKDRVAIIKGVEKLYGAPVVATDLRAGSALVLAGLVAEGKTEISGADVLDRGYENLEGKLQALGARVHRERHAIEEALC